MIEEFCLPISSDNRDFTFQLCYVLVLVEKKATIKILYISDLILRK